MGRLWGAVGSRFSPACRMEGRPRGMLQEKCCQCYQNSFMPLRIPPKCSYLLYVLPGRRLHLFSVTFRPGGAAFHAGSGSSHLKACPHLTHFSSTECIEMSHPRLRLLHLMTAVKALLSLRSFQVKILAGTGPGIFCLPGLQPPHPLLPMKWGLLQKIEPILNRVCPHFSSPAVPDCRKMFSVANVSEAILSASPGDGNTPFARTLFKTVVLFCISNGRSFPGCFAQHGGTAGRLNVECRFLLRVQVGSSC